LNSITLEKLMIDNFAIAFFTICVIYTAFRAIKLERLDKELDTNPDKPLGTQQQQKQSVLDNSLR
jgi:hypothetical protein